MPSKLSNRASRPSPLGSRRRKRWRSQAELGTSLREASQDSLGYSCGLDPSGHCSRFVTRPFAILPALPYTFICGLFSSPICSSFLTMTQTKFGVSHFRGRLLKSAATSALALSAVAGGVVMQESAAQALSCDFVSGLFTGCNYGAAWPGDPGSPIPPGPTPVPSITSPITGQWLETNIQYNNISYYYPTDKQVWFFNAPSNSSGNIEFYWIDVTNNGDWKIPPDPQSVDQWHVDVDYNPDLVKLDGQSIFQYAIRTIPQQPFHDVSLQAVLTSPSIADNYVNKKVWAGTVGVGGNPICTFSGPSLTDQTVPPSPSGFDNSVNGLTLLCVQDTAEVPSATDTLDNYQNVYRQTPGPLPILGAGAALGFSRKLRSRIKASRTA